MPMAPATAWGPPGLLSRTGFLVLSPSTATTTVRLGRHARPVTLGVAARSGPRDGEWGADPDPDPSTGTGRMVDEDMATLRRRIREARAAASEDDDDDNDAGVGAPPLSTRWTELERRHHESYVAGVRGAARLLEALLDNARPGHGVVGVLALLLLLLLGVPASAFLVCAKLVQALDAIWSAVNGR
jgi:hypothetical protein